MRYLSFYILRSDMGDATNKGVTSPDRAKGKGFLVPCESGNWNDEDIARNPERFVIFDVIQSEHSADYRYLRPRCAEERWTMMGGNFGYSCDSRFTSEVSRYPLPIHDRIEG
jgi:hypothetical protein